VTKLGSGKARPWASPLGDFVGPLVEPVLAKHGFGESSLIADWPAIVGANLAGGCRPIRLQWPPRAPKRDPGAPAEPATLVLRVEGAMSLEIQHSAAVIVERVNAHLGWNCVGRLAFRQGPLEKAASRVRRKSTPGAKAISKGRAAAAGVESEDLRAALERLGARAIAAEEERKSLPTSGKK
jgi:hypothetical protein